MLRTALFALGGALLLWGVARALNGGGILGPAIPGTILLLALIGERYVYKPIREDVPGPEWQRTTERFTDPGSGRDVVVYFHPRTGERRYIASSGDDAAAGQRRGDAGGAGKT